MIIRKNKTFHFGEKELAEETFGWLFIDFIPLLYEKKKVARQLQIETWLDLTQLVKELNIGKANEIKRYTPSATSYIV